MRKSKIFALFFLLGWQWFWSFGCKKADFTYNELILANGQSYDFSAGTFDNAENGDFYFFCEADQDKFWANNAGQRGVIDMGDLDDTDLADVAIPASGYLKSGVLCVVGHVYVSLAQAGEEGHHIVFRVLALTANTSCRIDWLYK